MSRRVWLVLFVVVAVLVVAPHLPQWWPALLTSLRTVDLAAIGRDALAGGQRVGALAHAALAYTAVRPQLVAGALGGVLLLGLGAVSRRALRRRAGTPRRRRGSISVMPEEPIARSARTITPTPPASVAVPAAPVPMAPAAAALRDSREPRSQRRGAGRGIAVRRLSAAGHSTAEIARATRVGQDAVRLVLRRQARS